MRPPPVTMHMTDEDSDDDDEPPALMSREEALGYPSDDESDDESVAPTKHNYMVSTVKENRMGFTEREFQGAKQAR